MSPAGGHIMPSASNNTIAINTPLRGLTLDEGIQLTQGRYIILTWNNTMTGQKEQISGVSLPMLERFSPKFRTFFDPRKLQNQRANPIGAISLGSFPLEKNAVLFVVNQILKACTAAELKNLDLPAGDFYRMLKVYAAAIILGIHRPTVQQWRTQILDQFNHTLTVNEIMAIWECLADDAGLVNHMIHIVTGSMRSKTLPDADANAINQYLGLEKNKHLRAKFDAALAEKQAKADLRKAEKTAAWEARGAKRQECWYNTPQAKQERRLEAARNGERALTPYDLHIMGFSL
ncbi:hypothetical protein SLS56_002808 [Neofusicoccum ribis]|uniref:Uncharacterized protein n=1 Tax=Neofusicoccum ribis TaxID=45134 RepID=A0ABR3T270_9PEZI